MFTEDTAAWFRKAATWDLRQVCQQWPSEALVRPLSGWVGGHKAPAWRPHSPVLAPIRDIPDWKLAMNT